jgi:hypothetical protein
VFPVINACADFRTTSKFLEGVAYEMVSGKLVLKEE